MVQRHTVATSEPSVQVMLRVSGVVEASRE